MPTLNTSLAVSAILDARDRQIAKGYDSSHDSAHVAGQLVEAAICHALTARGDSIHAAAWWPFACDFHPAASDKEAVIIAAALLLAELERILRLEGDAA